MIHQIERMPVGIVADLVATVHQNQVPFHEVGFHLDVAQQTENSGSGQSRRQIFGERKAAAIAFGREFAARANRILDDRDSRIGVTADFVV